MSEHIFLKDIMEAFYLCPDGKKEKKTHVLDKTVTSSCGNFLLMVTIVIGLPFYRFPTLFVPGNGGLFLTSYSFCANTGTIIHTFNLPSPWSAIFMFLNLHVVNIAPLERIIFSTLVATILVHDSCWPLDCCHSSADLIGQIPCRLFV